MVLVNKKILLDNVLATFEIEEMAIPEDKKDLLWRYLNEVISEEELLELNNLRIQALLESYMKQNE